MAFDERLAERIRSSLGRRGSRTREYAPLQLQVRWRARRPQLKRDRL